VSRFEYAHRKQLASSASVFFYIGAVSTLDQSSIILRCSCRLCSRLATSPIATAPTTVAAQPIPMQTAQLQVVLDLRGGRSDGGVGWLDAKRMRVSRGGVVREVRAMAVVSLFMTAGVTV
jgi:hypothetical protein